MIKIVLDSSSDLRELEGIDFACAPLVISTDERDYVDDATLDVRDMANTLYTYKGKSRTSCPNIEDWLAAFGDAEEIFVITITSSLSGSYNSARNAKLRYEEEHPERRVELIDSFSTGPEIALMAERIRDMVLEGMDFDTVREKIKEYRAELIFVLESMKNLANNGRVSRLAATAAGLLGIRAIGRASEQGTLEMLGKSRGSARAVLDTVSFMKKFGYVGGRVIITNCLNEAMANTLKERLSSEYPGADIVVRESGGLCSFYAERGGLLIGFERE